MCGAASSTTTATLGRSYSRQTKAEQNEQNGYKSDSPHGVLFPLDFLLLKRSCQVDFRTGLHGNLPGPVLVARHFRGHRVLSRPEL